MSFRTPRLSWHDVCYEDAIYKERERAKELIGVKDEKSKME